MRKKCKPQTSLLSVCRSCLIAGLDLEREDDEAADSADLQSPNKELRNPRPCNYLAAMLTYIAQVALTAAVFWRSPRPQLMHIPEELRHVSLYAMRMICN